MNKYQVQINGRNFLIEINGVLAMHGFYTTRYIEAQDAVEAENMAMDLIRKRGDIRKGIRNSADDMPMMFAEEIYTLDDFDDVETFEEGLAWYKEEEPESDEIFEARITNYSSRAPKGGSD